MARSVCMGNMMSVRNFVGRGCAAQLIGLVTRVIVIGLPLLVGWLLTTFVAVVPAQADCVNQGVRVICSGRTEGLVLNGATTVQVNGGAELLPANAASFATISHFASLTVDNGGVIIGNNIAVNVRDSVILNNTGTIVAIGDGVVSRNVKVTNSGHIEGGDTAINFLNNGEIVSNGSLKGVTTISGTGDLSLINTGDITGSEMAVRISLGSATIDNEGTITSSVAGKRAISINEGLLTLTNSGTITGTVLGGRQLIATNLGTINGNGASALHTTYGSITLVNDGSLSGTGIVSSDALGTGLSTITNNGSMTSVGPVAAIDVTSLVLDNPGDILALDSDSTVIVTKEDAEINNAGTISGNGTGIHVRGDAIINNTGEIRAGSASGIASIGTAVSVLGKATIVNDGRVAANGLGFRIGPASEIINNGDIEITGSALAGALNRMIGGFHVIGASTINNIGNISVVSKDSFAINSMEALTLDNSGKISVKGDNSVGVTSIAELTIINSGLVSVSGKLSNAIVSGDILTLTNTGDIEAENGAGVLANSRLELVNRGRIAGVTGVMVVPGAGPAEVSNFDTIIGTGGVAISLTDAADIVTLGAGSKIQGIIALGGGKDIVNIDVSDGTSRILTFDDLSEATLNVTGAPHFSIIGNSLIILNPTAFYLKNSAVLDVRLAVGDIVQSRINERIYKDDTLGGFYIKLFGGISLQSKSKISSSYRNTHFGAILGFEKQVSAHSIIGGFLGGAWTGGAAAGNDGATSDATYGIGGLYGRLSQGAFFIDLNVVGGYVSSATKMDFRSNVATNGVEKLDAASTGTFVSPEAGIGVNFLVTPDTVVSPALRYRRTMINWESKKITTATGLSIGAKPLTSSEIRAELQVTHTQIYSDAMMKFQGTIGGIYQMTEGGDFSFALNGVSLPDGGLGQRKAKGVFLVGGIGWREGSGITYSASIRGDWRTDNSLRFSSRAGALMNF